MFYLIFVFLFGLIIGSFLNAVIYRLEAGKSVFRGRSFCPKCKHILSWYDLAPLFSFILLKGKCRYCRQKISIQYPLVELATGILFSAIFHFFVFNGQSIFSLAGGSAGGLTIFNEFPIALIFDLSYWFYIASVLIIIFVYDLKYYIIPDRIVLPAIAVSLIWNLTFEIYLFAYGGSAVGGEIKNLKLSPFGRPLEGWEIIDINYLLAAFGAAGFFFLLIILSRGRWMGFGDVKFAFLMGLVLGFPNILLALFTAFTSGAIIGVGLMLFKKKNLKSQIQFGPFLVGGTIFSLFFGKIIINWYLNFLL